MARDRADFGSVFRRRRDNGRPVGPEYRGEVKPGYYVRVQVGARQVWRKAGASRKEATEFLAQVQRNVFEEDVLGVQPVEETTFRKLAKDYLEHVEVTHAATTVRNERSRIDSTLVPAFGDVLVSKISTQDIERFLTKRRAEGASVATRNRYAAILSAMFRRAVALGHARANPVKGIERPSEPMKEVPFLSFDEQDRLVEHCGQEIRPFVATALETGARRGELLALLWSDVDFQRSVISIRRSKNGTARTIPMSARCRATLEPLRANRVRPLHEPDRVFAAIPESWPGNWHTKFGDAVKAAKLPELRVHDLRHAFAVNMSRAGVPLSDLRKLLGHKTLVMVLRYSRHCPADSGEQALVRLEAHRAATAEAASKAARG